MSSFFTPENILISLITSLFGTVYLVYGKKNARIRMILSGCALLAYPYFVDQVWLSALIGIVLIIVPPLSFKYY